MIEEMKRKCVEIETLTIGMCNENSIVKRRVIRDEILKLTRELQPKEKPQEPEKLEESELEVLQRIARETATRLGMKAHSSWNDSPAYWIGRFEAEIRSLRKDQEPEETPEEEGDKKRGIDWCSNCRYHSAGYCDKGISEPEEISFDCFQPKDQEPEERKVEKSCYNNSCYHQRALDKNPLTVPKVCMECDANTFSNWTPWDPIKGEKKPQEPEG